MAPPRPQIQLVQATSDDAVFPVAIVFPAAQLGWSAGQAGFLFVTEGGIACFWLYSVIAVATASDAGPPATIVLTLKSAALHW